MFNMHVQYREFETAIDACDSFEQVWERLCKQCRSFGFAAAKLNYDGEIFEEKFADATRDCWNVVVPMGEHVLLYLSVPPDAAHNMLMMMSVMARISSKLPQNNQTLEYEPALMAAVSAR